MLAGWIVKEKCHLFKTILREDGLGGGTPDRGNVYKQILIDAKLKTGAWDKSLKR
jgi:hypothetical protein